MTTSAQPLERDILETLKQSYEEKGYIFYMYPTKEIVPSFLGSYLPDAIAKGDDEKIVIEVKQSRDSLPSDRLKEISSLFENNKEWSLRIFFANEVERKNVVPPSRESVLTGLNEAEQIAAAGHNRAALLLAWSAFEAAVNSYHQQSDIEVRSKTVTAALEELERDGVISFDTTRKLRSLQNLRNEISHGDWSTDVADSQIRVLADTVRSLASGLE